MAGGRPTILTDELQTRITDVIRAGNYIETAASYAGISKNTIYDWMKRGAKERRRIETTGKKPLKKELPFLQFSDAIEKALAESEIRDVTRIGQASQTDWKAAAWRLERKFPQKWGKKFQQIDGNEDEKLLKMELLRLQVEKAQAELSRLSGDTGDDAHDLIANYTKALEGNVANAFADEQAGDLDETES